MVNLNRNPVITALIILVGLLTVTPVAEAHKVNMFAYVEGNDIFIEGYFSDGRKAINAAVTAARMDAAPRLPRNRNIPAMTANTLKLELYEMRLTAQ